MSDFRTTANPPNEPPLPEALAYFLTWTTYGTWLPGDERGWVRHGKGFQLPDPVVQAIAESRMTESACTLDREQRALVEETITDHCRIRGWKLHAVRCRSNHVHVVVAVADRPPDEVREQFKAWCTRKLKALQRARDPAQPIRENWWTAKGSDRWIGDLESLEAVIYYVREAQDRKGRDLD